MPNYQQLVDSSAAAVLAKWQIPNVAAALVRDQGATVASAAQGVRNADLSSTLASNQIAVGDYFTVGSVSKAIFGMFVACLIKHELQGKLDWSTKIADAFPEFTHAPFRARCGMNTNFQSATVAQLLAHTAGMDGSYYFVAGHDPAQPGEAEGIEDPFRFIDDWTILPDSNSRDVEWQNLQSVMHRRYLYTVLCMKQGKFTFSQTQNLGYQNTHPSGYGSSAVVVAAMIERLADKPFETLMADVLANVLPMDIIYGAPPNGMQMHSYDGGTGKYTVWKVANQPVATGPFAQYESKFMTGTMSCTAKGLSQFITHCLTSLASSAPFDLAGYLKPVTDTSQGGFPLSPQSPNKEPYWHTGQLGGGCNAYVEVYPTAGRGVAVAINADGGPDPTAPAGSTPNGADAAMWELVGDLRNIAYS